MRAVQAGCRAVGVRAEDDVDEGERSAGVLGLGPETAGADDLQLPGKLVHELLQVVSAAV